MHGGKATGAPKTAMPGSTGTIQSTVNNAIVGRLGNAIS
jgi:hypothetical protein